MSRVSPADGMFCSICQKWGKPPAGLRGGWTTRGITDWNHASELLKQHADSLWHGDAAGTAAMTQQVERSGQSVLELHCSSAARESAERIQRNRSIISKLLRAVYFLVQHRIPHTTIYQPLFQLLVVNGDSILEQHIEQHPSNAQYTSKFSVAMMIDAMDCWLERR